MRQVMVRGGRAPAEFIDGQRRRNARAPSHSEPEALGPMPHVDLRVIRKAELKPGTPEREEWRDFLDEFAEKNRALGTGRTLGAVAMTYIPAKHMNSMLASRYPKDYGHRKKKLGLFRKVNANLKAFMAESEKRAAKKVLEDVQAQHDDRIIDWRADHVTDLFDAEGKPAKIIPDQSVTDLSPTEKKQLATYRFGPAVLAVRGLSLVEGTHYSADLSGDELAHHERQDLKDFLRYEEKLEVRMLDADWKPHATLFVVHSHLQVPDNLPLRENAPYELAFSPPTTESYGLDGTVLSR